MTNTIEKEIEDIEFFIEQSPKSKDYTLFLKKNDRKQYALSKYIPREYAIKSLGEEFGNKDSVWILLGFGFGYMLEELVEKVGTEVKVIIIEPNEVLLNEQIKVFGSKELLSKDNIKILTGSDFTKVEVVLKEFISQIDFNNVKIKSIELYLSYYNNYYNKIISLIDECIMRHIINFNTIAFNKEICFKNIIRNRHSIVEGYDLANHRNAYQKIPALIVSAGPSLKKNIDQIKNFKGIVFAIGRTITPILEQGVNPDFVVSVDPHDIIYDTFNKYKQYDIPLITMCEGNSKVVQGAKGAKYFIHNSSALNELLGIRTNPVLPLSGSVATLCLSLAEYMGCNPIIFIGQDLAYTNDEKHCGLALDNENDIKNNKLSKGYNNLKIIKSYDGADVYSDDSLVSFLRWIEDFIREHNDYTYINATEGGAYIQGALHISLKETIETYCNIEKPIIEHKLFVGNEGINVDQNLYDAVKKLEKIREYVSSVKTCYENLIQRSVKENAEHKYNIKKIVKKIKKMDEKILKINQPTNIIGVMMENIALAIASSNTSKEPIYETPEELTIRKFRLNYETYKELELESEKMIQVIKKEIE